MTKTHTKSERLVATVPDTHRDAARQVMDDDWVGHVRERLEQRDPGLLIGNEWVVPQGARIGESINPSTGRESGRFVFADAAAVDGAVRAAAKAQPAWAARTVWQRAECFSRFAQLIREHAAEIAAVEAIDAGLPILRTFTDIDGALNALRGWPGLASSLRGEVLPDHSRLNFTQYSPYGVVVKIVAFNHPFLFAVKGSLAALIAGNTLVLKPADQTPLSALYLGDLVREAFPPGVFNIVTGGPDTGEAMVSHPLVRRVAFTGSSVIGRRIQETAARDQVRNVTLELGGKNPMIVFGDAPIRDVAKDAIFGMNMRVNQGQSCGSTSRVLVHRNVYEEFLDSLGAMVGDLKIGPAYFAENDMGPLISARQATRVREFIKGGLESGARLITGGLDDDRVPQEGFFVAPTVFADVDSDSRLGQEEVFGPVISVGSWDDYDAMIDQANCVEYGLTASIWTNDLDMALTTANKLDVGYVWVNESTRHVWGTPFGGWKNSGVGREECMEELLGYMQLKSVHVRLTGDQGGR